MTIQFGTLTNGETLFADTLNPMIEFLNANNMPGGPVVIDAQGNISAQTVLPTGGTVSTSLASVAASALAALPANDTGPGLVVPSGSTIVTTLALIAAAALAIPNLPVTVSATGTIQTTATQLSSSVNIITSGTDGAGVILSGALPLKVFNRVAGNNFFVYPPIGGEIDQTGTVNTPVILPPGSQQTFTPESATWYVG